MTKPSGHTTKKSPVICTLSPEDALMGRVAVAAEGSWPVWTTTRPRG